MDKIEKENSFATYQVNKRQKKKFIGDLIV